jgi:Zn-dependent protease with chaperone function
LLRTTLASALALTVLGAFLFAIAGLTLYFTPLYEWAGLFGLIGLQAALFLVVWLVSPTFSDWIYEYFYGVHWLSMDALKDQDPQLAAFIETTCGTRGIKSPRIGLIEDLNPQAFTYGSDHWNARMVFTRGIFTFLDEEERKAVAAHELGHIVHRDFIVMSLAAFILTLLYVIGRVLIRMRGGRKNPLPLIGLLSLAFYYVGHWVLLFLSRTREYAADAFAKQECGGNALSRVLVKIAYGIVTTPDTERTRDLMEGTRTLGIFDHKTANTFGLIGTDFVRNRDATAVTNAMVYDLHNLWAFWLELGSSHPLTGKRIRALLDGEKSPVFEVAAVDRYPFDRVRHLGQFVRDWTVANLWLIAGAACMAAWALHRFPFAAVPVAAGVGLIVAAIYRYPSGAPAPVTVDQLMSDPYASPVRGKRCALEGRLVGRGVPGYQFSEDFMFEDRTGLLFIDYEHWMPWLGNLVFAVARAAKLVGLPASCDGWFLRGFSQHLALNRMRCGDEVLESYPRLVAVITGLLVIALGGIFWVAGDPMTWRS